MKIRDLDRPEYAGIPLYTIGPSSHYDSPVFISKCTDQDHLLSPLHRHNVVQINYISYGRLIHQVNHSKYELVRGDIFVIPPYVPHQLIALEKNSFEVVEVEFASDFIFGSEPNSFHALEGGQSVFDFSYIEPFLVSERNVRPRLNLTGKTQMKVEELLDEIYGEFTRKNDSYLLAIKADLLKLLVIVGRALHEEIKGSSEMQFFNHQRDAMLQAIRYIDQHYTEPISIEDVTRSALLSQSYFRYLFKTLTNKTFVEYLHTLRIRKAMDLLKNTEDRVVDICFDSGFSSINYFNRTFRTMVGVSPTQYRAANRRLKETRAGPQSDENSEDGSQP